MRTNKRNLLKKMSAACEGTRPVDHLRLLARIALLVFLLAVMAWAGGRIKERITPAESAIERAAE